MEPLDIPEHWGGSDAMEPPSAEWRTGDEPAWEASGLDRGEGTLLVLDAGDPLPADEWPGFPEE